jgi:hypothetical protein
VVVRALQEVLLMDGSIGCSGVFDGGLNSTKSAAAGWSWVGYYGRLCGDAVRVRPAVVMGSGGLHSEKVGKIGPGRLQMKTWGPDKYLTVLWWEWSRN